MPAPLAEVDLGDFDRALRSGVRGTFLAMKHEEAKRQAAVLWLCSAEASFINGAVLPVDGGQGAGLKPPRMYRAGEPMQPT